MDFEEARSSLDVLAKCRLSQMMTDAVLKHLRCVADRLNEATRGKHTLASAEQMWCDETKLLDFPDVFIRIVHAEELAKDSEPSADKDNAPDYSREILRQAIAVLTQATQFAKFSKVFHTRNVAVYLLNVLSRKVREPYQDQQLKQLDFLDANSCMNAIGNALANEAQIGEQLRLHQCTEVLQRFFACTWDEVALRAVLLCAEINPDPTSDELKVPERTLKYLMKTLLLLLYGQVQKVNNIHTPATTYLAALQQLILASDDFNKRIAKFKYESIGITLIELLSQVLEAPEPTDVDPATDYFHENIADKAGNVTKQLYTTFAEKHNAVAVCWALLLSEFRYRRNSREMRKHKRIIPALKDVAAKPVKNLVEAAGGVLWLLKKNQTDSDEPPPAEANQDPSEEAEQKQKLLEKRATAAPNVIAKQSNDVSVPVSVPLPVPVMPIAKRTVVISYCSLYKPQMAHRINKSLKQAKIEAAVYNERLMGNAYETLAKAIEECAVMLVCYSSAYSKSDACHAKLIYARFFSKPIVYVRLENFTPFGWLGMTIGDAGYHDFALSEFDSTEEGDVYNVRLRKLLAELSKFHP